jgi:hypothetical protein
MTTRSDAINDALERLTGYHYVDGQGFAVHGPMAAEALSCLGFDEHVASWIDRYVSTHAIIEPPPRRETIDPADDRSWRYALGDFSRVTDWNDMFERELRAHPWHEVLRAWVPRLVTGYGGGLTHGLLRTAHAARAIPVEGSPSDLMLGEMAKGLASWAGWYRTLPGEPHLRGALSLEDAVERVPRPREAWSPVEAGTLSRFGELEQFADAVEALRAPDDVGEALSDLSATFCRKLVGHREAFPIGLVHTVTPVAVTRTLLALVPELSTERVYARLWQVDAALLAGFTRQTSSESGADVLHRETPSTQELAARAATHPEPHVVKFTEACLREYARRADPVYLIAADDLVRRLSSP